MPETIYMRLVDEGSDAWRPVDAERRPDGSFQVLGPVPDGETWAFPPGVVVRCEVRRLSGNGGQSTDSMVVVAAID